MNHQTTRSRLQGAPFFSEDTAGSWFQKAAVFVKETFGGGYDRGTTRIWLLDFVLPVNSTCA